VGRSLADVADIHEAAGETDVSHGKIDRIREDLKGDGLASPIDGEGGIGFADPGRGA
jgi:hypothetical protein